MAKKSTPTPPGIDKAALRAFHKKALSELTRDAKAYHAANVQLGRELTKSATRATRLLKISSKDARATLGAHLESTMHKEIRKTPPKLSPPTGHNPARYAPYSFPWSHMEAGGIGYASFYPVSAQSGTVGADLVEVIGGAGSAASALGFWYQAQHSGNLFVNAQISISGAAEVQALPGYARSNSRVKVFVQQYQPWYSWSAESSIWDRSAYVLGGDIVRNLRGLYSASVTVPVAAGRLYCIWGALYQNVVVGGIGSATSNFRGWVAPITYIEV